MAQDLAGTAAAAKDWFDTAIPLWLAHGVDRARGGMAENLDPATLTVPADYRRLRVATRQTYVFAAAARLGHAGAREAMELGLAFILGPARHPGGGFSFRFDLDGRTLDATRDLYDLAFVLFALAHAHRVTADPALAAEARALAAFIEGAMRHPAGGFVEALPPRLPRRQNPHMHLFEALLAWEVRDPAGPWTRLRDEVLGLFATRFLRAEAGYLGEYFDDALAPAPGREGRIWEPGHHFEWVWLLDAAEKAGAAVPPGAGAALYARALAEGIDAASGLAHGEVAAGEGPLGTASRLWTLTEWLKAEAVTPGPDRGARVARVWAGIERFLDVAPRGLWRERWEPGTGFRAEPSPATSLYHVVLAIETLLEAAGAHPAPFAG
jgi:mannose-6-phosphate isomerase